MPYTTVVFSEQKKFLGDILSSATGMNRGRMRWGDIRKIDVPIHNEQDTAGLEEAVATLEALWEAKKLFSSMSTERLGHLIADLKLEGKDSRIRWLAYKPPE
jgi:hypothetical protein